MNKTMFRLYGIKYNEEMEMLKKDLHGQDYDDDGSDDWSISSNQYNTREDALKYGKRDITLNLKRSSCPFSYVDTYHQYTVLVPESATTYYKGPEELISVEIQ